MTALLDFALNLYVYDGNGNTVAVIDSISGPIVTATWDYEDRPVRIELMSQFGPITYTATYDGLHRRAWGQYGSPLGSIEAKLLWDEEKLLSTNDFFNDSTLGQFTNEPGQYGPLVSTAAQGESFAYHFDGPGSTQQMTDGGQVVRADIVYKAFGEMLSNTGDAPNIFFYIGQWGYQTELPFWSYVRRRYLASDFGRWLSRDPVELERFRVFHQYHYAGNNPMKHIDPLGLLTEAERQACIDASQQGYQACITVFHPDWCRQQQLARDLACELAFLAENDPEIFPDNPKLDPPNNAPRPRPPVPRPPAPRPGWRWPRLPRLPLPFPFPLLPIIPILPGQCPLDPGPKVA